jgi:hypothetical protein
MSFQYYAALLICSLSLTSSALELLHEGAADPLTEGWSGSDFFGTSLRVPVDVPDTRITLEPIRDQEAAWLVADTSDQGFSNYLYMQGLTDSEVFAAVSNPWELSVRLKLGPEGVDERFGSVFAAFFTGTQRYQMTWSRMTEGHLVVRLNQGAVAPILIELPGLDTNGYHDYALRYSPVSQTAELFVDETLVGSNYNGRVLSTRFPYVGWGSAQGSDTGYGQYARVRFLSEDDADADCVFAHYNDVDPLEEGWRGGEFIGTSLQPIVTPHPSILVGPVTNDFEFPAWQVHDTSTDPFTDYVYYRDVAPVKVQVALDTGWTLSTRLKVPSSDTIPRSIGAYFATGSRRFQMTFGAEPDGDPIIRINQGGEDVRDYSIAGVGPGYHLYEMIYDPCTTSAVVYVDGVGVISNVIGRVLTSNPYVAFGSSQGSDAGNGLYNYVQFSFVPLGQDRDNDGMPDAYEHRYFLDPDNPDDADEDADGDGLSNKDEVLTRTNPNGSGAGFFIPLSPLETANLRGDINADGFLDPRDLTLFLQIAAGAKTPSAYELIVSDINKDGNRDGEDAELLQRLLRDERIGNRITLPYTGVGMVYTVECRRLSQPDLPWQVVYRFVGNGRAQSHFLPPWPFDQRACRIRVNRTCPHGP